MTTAHSNEIDSQILIDQDPGSGSGFFENGDPDPVWNWPDPKHWYKVLYIDIDEINFVNPDRILQTRI